MSDKKIAKIENNIESLLDHMLDSYISSSDIQKQALDEYKYIKTKYDDAALDSAVEINKMLDSKLKTALDALKLNVELSKIHERLVKNELGSIDESDDNKPNNGNKMTTDFMKQIKEEINNMKKEQYEIE